MRTVHFPGNLSKNLVHKKRSTCTVLERADKLTSETGGGEG